jgi:hypothetical protein
MLVCKLRIGFRIDGVAITGIERVRDLSVITLRDGTKRTEHKATDIPDVSASLAVIPSGPVRSKYINGPRNVRASSTGWRGESDGKRGERFRARTNAYDLYRVDGR